MFIIGIILCAPLCAQNFSNEVSLVRQDEATVTLRATATADKKKDASLLAAQSAFYTLLYAGVPELKNGVPMMLEEKKDYNYRLFNESRYISYISGEIQNVGDKKIGGKYRVTVQLTVALRSLKNELERNKFALSPGWSDAKAANPTAALNPTIVVVPYVKGEDNGFEAMRREVENRPVVKYVIGQLTSEFGKNGYKTRDFITQLQNSKTSAILRQDSQSDVETKIVQMLPGDIVVIVDVAMLTDDRHQSECRLELKAVEKQTAGNLGNASFASGRYITADTLKLAGYALGKIKGEFFTGLHTSFENMVKKGREVSIEMTLSETVTDWDFDQESPEGNQDLFKDALDEWLRSHAYQSIYDMSLSTDKYIQASVNVPLWNQEKNRSYTLSNFGSELKAFFKEQFGGLYKASVTAMGQKLVITIE